MLKIIRFLFGFVVFTVSGKFPERFLNLTAREGICLWDIKKDKDIIYAKVMASEYKSLVKSASKAVVLLKIQKKCGLPFFIKKYKTRPGLPIGAICFCIIIYFFSLFIWNVNVVGNGSISEQEIIHILSEFGLSPGAFKGNLDTKILAKSAMIKIGDAAWLALNIKGTTAMMEVQEKIEKPELVKKEKPCNIKAAKGGQIIRIEVYDGMAEVKNGDAVSKGDLLVNSFEEDVFGNNTMHHARAKVLAITNYTIHEKINLTQIIEEETGQSIKRRSVSFFGAKIPLNFFEKPKNEEYKREFKIDRIKVGKNYLPVIFYEEKWIKKKKRQMVLSKEMAKNMAKEVFEKKEKQQLENKKILNKEIKESLTNGVYYVSARYTCEEDIAQQEEILVN